MTRGKIMRDTNAGPGIVFVNGEQKSFTLESHWKSILDRIAIRMRAMECACRVVLQRCEIAF